jgi:hypothetical protein
VAVVTSARDPIRLRAMSRRIEIELTSARPDGSWTWRAAGAKVPKGVLEGSILPEGSATGDVLKVEAEFEMEGISISSVVSSSRMRKEAARIELLPSERSFDPVMQTLAPKREGGWDRDRGDRPRRDRGDRPGGDRGRPGGGDRGPRPDGGRGPRPDGARGPRPDGARGPRPDGDRPRRDRPRFEPVPELPQRPRPKRLKPGKTHRTAVLASLPEAQRAIADKALQGGLPAVRLAVQEQNAALRAAGQEEIPAAGLLKMAEELLPSLRVAEWMDRAEAAKADLAELDLRDLRSVVAAADDPMVTRDETARTLATELKAALISKQEQASQEWIEDISMAVEVGRVIRGLKLSSEPPKAGMRFPAELGAKLAEGATAALSADSTPDRWTALLEAVAFSPVRAQVTPAAPPTQGSDELTKTVQRLAAAIPQIAALFGITVAAGASLPKPQRPVRKDQQRKGAPAPQGGGRPPAPPKAAAAPAAGKADVEVETSAPSVEAETADVVVVEGGVTAEAEAVVADTVIEAEAAPAAPAAAEAPVAEAEVAAVAEVEAPAVQVERAVEAPVEAGVVEVEAETAVVEAAPAAVVEAAPAAVVEAAPAAVVEAVPAAEAEAEVEVAAVDAAAEAPSTDGDAES